MKRRKNSNLHVVREPEDPTDKIIEEIMDELNSEDGVTEKEIQEELARRKRKKQKKIGIVIAVIAIAAILVYLLINLQTYTKVRRNLLSESIRKRKMEPVISDKESDDRCQRQVGSSS